MILIKDLNFSYKKDKEILKNINLNINDNEVILISGISGSGKSTLFNCFNGLIPHFYNGILSGDIIINLNNTKDLALHEISEHVGSVFQDPRSQFFTTDTTDEISFVCQNMAMDKDEIFKKVDDVFSFFSIEYLKDKNIFKLSSGEKQKIAIASAAVISPSIYIFDEPSANLDFDSINKLSELFRLLKKEGHTVIIIEHRIYYLKDLFDKMIHMDGGEIKKVYSISDMSKMSNFDFNHLGLRSFDMDKIDFKNNETSIKKATREKF
ncbi:ABC transporter ATP-binding protein [Methanobrevibacter oralis]|uniref:ABC transporter ATP-binding protein n=1 Tax=Methanobrevibacter oralis TaxID=66851 RepID=UPI001C72F84E|nr:ABC transporter ATP-binding protein [Methanobrevibacter oralis]